MVVSINLERIKLHTVYKKKKYWGLTAECYCGHKIRVWNDFFLPILGILMEDANSTTQWIPKLHSVFLSLRSHMVHKKHVYNIQHTSWVFHSQIIIVKTWLENRQYLCRCISTWNVWRAVFSLKSCFVLNTSLRVGCMVIDLVFKPEKQVILTCWGLKITTCEISFSRIFI